MREENESSESYPESVKDILQELSCRLCLYRHEKNARITSPSCSSTDLINKISKHLPVEVTQDREFPIWICKFCEQSLESFHKFYSKVKQVHESLTGLLSVLKNGNHGETIRLDEELNEIETTVGFARGKKVRATSLNTKSEPTRRTSRRTQARKTEHSTEGQNCSSTEKSEDPFSIEGNIQNESNVSSPFTHNKSNRPGKAGPCVVIKMEDMEESVSNDCDPDQADLPMFQGVVCVKDDDLSSLEDQDWVGQGFNFDTDSDNDLNWKPPPSEGSKNRSSKRKKPGQQTVKEDVENVTEKSDHSVEVVASQVCKKTKLRITATHGTEPKPKVPAAVRKMLREEMNARFVDFYGITCDICVKNFPSNSAAVEPVKFQTFDELCSHMQKEHDVRGYVKCCNCTMRERKRAERHMLLHTDPGSIYKCNICGKQLSSQQSFRCHILLHLPDSERPFQCNLCDRGFVSKADLNAHERQHLPEDKRLLYTCDICGSRFSYETGLVIHKQRVHENIRPHLCDLCAKSFSSRCDMERHRAQIHGNVKREQCPECGKWFKGQSILKTHMQRHKGALFQCQFCDKKYNVRSSWKAHLLIHTDVKPHKCPVCEKSFKLPGTLKMHLNQHTGDLPYVCQFCPKKFASSGNYYTHRKRMHGDEVAQLKEATEAALAASGLPPPLSVPPATVTKSISEAIARTKEIVAAKAKQAAEANTLLPSQDQVMMNVEAPVLLPDVADGIVSMVVDAPHQISLTSSSSSDLRAQMVSVPLPQNSNNSVILSQPSDTSIPVTMSTINETSKTVHLIPNLKMPVGSNPGTFVGSLKLVRLISPDGTSKLVFMKEDELTGNIASLGKISAITLDT